MAYIFDGIFSVDTDDVGDNVGLLDKGVASVDTSKTGGTNINGIYSSRLDRYLTVAVTPSDSVVAVTQGSSTISANTNGTYTMCLGKTYSIAASKTGYTSKTVSYTCTDNYKASITLAEEP